MPRMGDTSRLAAMLVPGSAISFLSKLSYVNLRPGAAHARVTAAAQVTRYQSAPKNAQLEALSRLMKNSHFG
jgi:hypothetical protein